MSKFSLKQKVKIVGTIDHIYYVHSIQENISVDKKGNYCFYWLVPFLSDLDKPLENCLRPDFIREEQIENYG